MNPLYQSASGPNGAVIKEKETRLPASRKWVRYTVTIVVLREARIIHFRTMNGTDNTLYYIVGHWKAEIVRSFSAHARHLVEEFQTFFGQFTLLVLSVNELRELFKSLIELV